MVGLPRFELGTSCTPNTGPPSLGSVDLGVFYGLHGFGASASAHCRWRWIEFLAHFCAQSVSVLVAECPETIATANGRP